MSRHFDFYNIIIIFLAISVDQPYNKDNLSVHMTIIYSKVFLLFIFVTYIFVVYFVYIIFLQYNVYISNRYLNSDDLSIDMTIYTLNL